MTAIDTQVAEDAGAIKALIQAFFDAINAADTKALQSCFFPGANLTIIRQDPALLPPPPGGEEEATTGQRRDSREESKGDERKKLTVVIRTSIEEFVRLLEDGKKRREGKPGPVLHESPDLEATEVRTDGLFGVAWSPFRVTFDGVLHHYGTMAYTLGQRLVEEEEEEAGGEKQVQGQKQKQRMVWRVEGLTQNYRRTPGWSVAEGEGVGVPF
ncbi:hypothetical protein VSDG_04309 [Cytospora chrysosperma]|uniref:SnoaL-like domain-containing protein n=1 Tax=Cytospora chrysosperma TaxID=252740 RepID=A0A423W5R8_CYTCH|nr:hypothetical protein VSDG_04309 [Valsa sordida]